MLSEAFDRTRWIDIFSNKEFETKMKQHQKNLQSHSAQYVNETQHLKQRKFSLYDLTSYRDFKK